MATAKRRAIDRLRRHKMAERKHAEIGRDLDAEQEAALEKLDDALDDDIGDDLLRLMFTACHPVLSTEARVALTLRLIGGLTTDEIARAFLVPEPTVAQRMVRAKRTLAEAAHPVRGAARRRPRRAALVGARGALPRVQRRLHRDRRRRLDAAAALRGRDAARPHPRRPRAGRAGGARPRRADGDPGLALRARAPDASGEPVLLLDQNRARWDQLLIRRGLAALDAGRDDGARGRQPLALTRCRPRSPPAMRGRARADETDWLRIVGLYGALAELTPSPIVELNRAVALSMAFGPEAGLELVDAIGAEPALKNYHLLPGVRGDLLVKLGRHRRGARRVRARGVADAQRARTRAAAQARGGMRGEEPTAVS